MKKLIVLCATLAAFNLPAAAQATAVVPAAAAVDPAAAAAVKELLVSMKYREMIGASFAQLQANLPVIMEQGASAAIKGNAKLSDAQKKAALDKVKKELPAAAAAFGATLSDPKLMDELVAETIPLYARHFTTAEIEQLGAFYKTPVGLKMLSTMPQIMSESMQISQKIMMPRLGAAIQQITPSK